jgi:hypothetical protein
LSQDAETLSIVPCPELHRTLVGCYTLFGGILFVMLYFVIYFHNIFSGSGDRFPVYFIHLFYNPVNITRYIAMVGTHENKSAYPITTGNEAESTRYILARKTYMTNNPGFKSVCIRMEGEMYERKNTSVV